MKVKVIECESFEDFLNVMHSQMDEVISKVNKTDDDNSSDSTEATPVYKKEMPVEGKSNEKKGKIKIPTTLDFYVKVLRKKHGISRDHIIYLLKELWKINRTSVYNILAKQVAITIDKMKYEDHISKSPKLFCINLFNGEVSEIKVDVKNGSLFAAFRTREDAELAKKILKPLLDEMF